jgi:subtilisin family serine protease
MRIIYLCLLAVILTNSTHMAAKTQFTAMRGERPPINLSALPTDVYEPGRFLIRITPEMHAKLPDILLTANAASFVQTGIPALDQLNEYFSIHTYKPFFAELYRTNSKTSENLERHKAWGFHLWFELHCHPGIDIIYAIQQFAALDEVEVAEPVYKKELIGSHEPDGYLDQSNSNTNHISGWIPNDPQFDSQWHYNNTGQSGGTPGADISLTEAWLIETGNQNLIVAVVDGGIDYNHADLAANMWDQIGYNFVNNSSNVIPHNHGTHVAGTVAAVSNNGTGVSGIAGGSGPGDGVRLMSCQVFTSASNGGFHLAPVYAADNGAAISQNSWGYTMDGVYEQPVLDAIDYFNAYGGGEAMEGGITIFSAGNSGSPGQRYPACYSGAFSVAATNNQDQKAWYSTYDYWVDISAPGGETSNVSQRGVLSTLTGNSYGYYQGTSMAAPHCSGVAALIISVAYGSLEAENLADILRNTTDDHYAQNPLYMGQLGTGRLNALNALLQVGVGNAPQNLTAFPGDESVFLEWDEPEPDTLDLLGYNIYRDNELINQLPISLTTFTDEILLNYQTYTYFVKAVYEDSESFRSNIVEVTPNTGYAGGNGTISDPFLIETAEQLYNVRFLPDSSFLQIANIDLGIYLCNENGGWSPIGNQLRSFTGSFDGNGFSILNLCIDRPTDSHAGLFGIAEEAEIKDLGLLDVQVTGDDYTAAIVGQLSNSSITRCFATGTITGSSFVGGITGAGLESNIDNTYSVCEVSGNNTVGGLAGFNEGTINNCYSTGFISGNILTGGLIGDSENSLISNSYWNYETSAQPASSGGEPLNTAEMLLLESFINWDFVSTWNITQNTTYPYLAWQEQAALHNYPPEFLPPSSLEAFADEDVIILAWNSPSMGEPSGYYIYRNGEKINNGAPVTDTSYEDHEIEGFELYSYSVTALYEVDKESLHSNTVQGMVLGFAGGSGTEANPFLVATAYQLDAVRLFLDKHFQQIADIDLGVAPWNEAEGWEPIGSLNNPFTGTYDGSDQKIINLKINKPNQRFVGLFSAVKASVIKNLFIVDVNITGKHGIGVLASYASHGSHIEYIRVRNANLHLYERYCGGLLGSMDDATVYRCYSTGSIFRGPNEDWNTIGGLIGAMTSSTTNIGSLVEECFSTVDLTSLAHNSYGGLLGGLWYKGEIKNSYARGSVTGTNARAGGILCDVSLGTAVKKINNSYSTGLVNAPGVDVNGFLGHNSGGTFAGNFYDSQTSGHTGYDPAATGKTTAQMKTQETFINACWDFDEVWAIDPEGIINDGYPYLQWQSDYPTCPPPANLKVSNITSSSVHIDWEPRPTQNHWEIIYGEHSFNPGNQGTLIENISDTMYTLTNLDHGMTYDVYVRSVCDDDLKSTWIGPATVTTVPLFQVAGGGSFCENSGIWGLDILLDGSETEFTYQLYRNGHIFGSSVIGTGDTLTWQNMVIGEYTVYAQGAAGSDWMLGSSSIIEHPLPLVTFIPERDTFCIDANQIVLSGGEPEGGIYSGTGVVNNVFFPEVAELGDHILYYTYTDDHNCANTDSVKITVDECIYVHNLGTEMSVEIFPNPTNGKLFIRNNNPLLQLEGIRVFSSYGTLVFKQDGINYNKTFILDLSELGKGFYSLQFLFKNQVVNKSVIIH